MTRTSQFFSWSSSFLRGIQSFLFLCTFVSDGMEEREGLGCSGFDIVDMLYIHSSATKEDQKLFLF